MENGKGKMVSVFLYLENGKWERENGERIFIF